MSRILYTIIQFTWGILQSAAGFVVFIRNVRSKHFIYHGSIVTEWKNSTSVSLGIFIFTTSSPYFADKIKDEFPQDEIYNRIITHEYGHTIQSVMLGPLYLFVIGIPSTVWAFIPVLVKKRRENKISYFAFFTEKWANYLGEKYTGEKALGNIVID